jgi:hypothetical protein
METPADMKAALGQIALAIGVKSFERLASQLDPDTMIQQATELIRVEIKEAFEQILGDENNPWASDLIDRLYQDLDAADVIEKIAGPLTAAMIDYFKQETTDLIDAIVAEIDLEAISELVAEKVAAKIQIGT